MTTTFAHSIRNGFVLLNSTPSNVRVTSRLISINEIVEVRLFGAGLSCSISQAFHEFDDLFINTPVAAQWSAHSRSAKLRVIRVIEGGWIAIVESKGALKPLNEPASEATSSQAGALRILASVAQARDGRINDAIIADEYPSFGGIRTAEVRCPIVGHESAICRLIASEDEEALDQERNVLAIFRKFEPTSMAEYLGLAQVNGKMLLGHMYATRPALRFTYGNRVLGEWLRANMPVVLNQLAALFKLSVENGIALNNYHPSAFMLQAFGIGSTPLPQLILVHAAQARPMGGRRPKRMGLALRKSLRYEKIGFFGAPPIVASGGVCDKSTEAQAWALGALEFLAPENAVEATSDWEGALSRCHFNIQNFQFPQFAAALLDQLERTPSALPERIESLWRSGIS